MGTKIGVDIDAVLTREGRGEDNIWHQKICNYFNLDTKQRDVYNFCKAYGLTEEEVEEFMIEKAEEIFSSLPSLPEAKKVLKELKDKGYTIILITARDKKHRETTLNWLKEHNIPYDQLIHSSNKAKICKELGVELFIDDHLDNLIPIKETMEIPILLMDMDHNKDYQGPIPRVNNWREIKNKVNKLLEER